MSAIKTFDDKNQLAQAAAKSAIDILWATINKYDHAVWVLAGGSTPLAAYQVIATGHRDVLDWSKVTLLLGDERIGPLSGDMNNWHAIDRILATLPARKLRPRSDLTAEEAASDYENYFSILPKNEIGLPRLDLVWLGVGEDGHTLSLFPNHSSLFPSNNLVVPVHDAPKPPRDRISLSLRSLQGAENAMILASGAEKHSAVSGAMSGNNSPIALAVSVIESHHGSVTWYVDKSVVSD